MFLAYANVRLKEGHADRPENSLAVQSGKWSLLFAYASVSVRAFHKTCVDVRTIRAAAQRRTQCMHVHASRVNKAQHVQNLNITALVLRSSQPLHTHVHKNSRRNTRTHARTHTNIHAHKSTPQRQTSSISPHVTKHA